MSAFPEFRGRRLRRSEGLRSLVVAAYQVSGEWASICAAAQLGWLDRDKVLMETLISIRRAGADMILTYGPREAAELLD